MTEKTTKPTLSIKSNLSNAWEIYKKQWQLLIGATIVLSIPDLLSSMITKTTENSIGIVQFILSICSLFLVSGGIYFILKIVRKENAEVADLFSQKDSFLQFFLGNIVVGIITILGIILFIIPGIIMSVSYSLVPFLIIDKKMEFREAMTESKRLTQNKKMQLFIYCLASGLIGASGILAFGVGVIVTLPIGLLLFAAAYEELTEKSATSLPLASK